ncbi:FxSxx-COOH system tetratricopeptide repeat protein [Streptomyces sp. NPDC058464]|uniref:FxSxx-COOH system tetratricopeptide repeat protein n=1 Tax=Streptomyces sp. NPDC058464 TaxID=3346511 RepID=UPI00365D1CE2
MTDTDAHAQRFFISYAGADRAWAEWIGWHLEQAGHTVILDVWDWRTGDDFVQRMDEALTSADAVVAVLSRAYFADGRRSHDERTAALARRDRMIPLAVEPLTDADVGPLLASKVRTDLHGRAEPAALDALREAVNGSVRPSSSPAFPPDGAAPAAPDQEKPQLPGRTDRPGVWNVRRRNPDFSGRETLIVALREGLLDGGPSVVHALHGMGGIGKTQIVVEYAHRFASQYDVVWWIDAEQSDQLPVYYAELAERLGVARAEAGAERNARLLLDDLRGRPRWLLVLDNVEHPDRIVRWLPEGPGHVLITSRNPNWRHIARRTDLDVFTRDDSLAYLTTRLRGITDDQAEALAKDLGDLPLALAQAAGVIGGGTTVERYRRLLDEKTVRVLEAGDAPDYPASLAGTVGIAARRLADHHPDAAALLRVAAFLGPEPIPTRWLEEARPRMTTIPGDPDDLMGPGRSLRHLSDYGLARTDSHAFQVHRLTQAVLRDHADPARGEAVRSDAAAVLAAAAPGDALDPGNWGAWASLTAHLTTAHFDVADRPELRPTLIEAVHFLIRSGQPGRAAALAAGLREKWVSKLGPDDPEVLFCAQYLGHATSDLGDFRAARPLIEDTYTRRRRLRGDDDPDTLQSANDLGAILFALGEREEAERISEDAFDRRRRVLGEDHPDTLQSASHRGTALTLSGRYAEARRINEDTVARLRRVRGVDHPHTLQVVGALATNLRVLGEYAESRRLLEETLAHCRRILGDDHLDTLRAMHGLASTLVQLGRCGEARHLLDEAHARCRRNHGDDHPDTLEIALALVLALCGLGESDASRRVAADTYERRRAVLGEDHPATLATAVTLVGILRERGELAEARRLDEDTFDRSRRTLGGDHPDTLAAATSLAMTLHAQRAYPAAAQLLEATLKRQRLHRGTDLPDIQNTIRALVGTYSAMNRKRQAHKLQKLLTPRSAP